MPIPSLLALSSVHHHLIRTAERESVGLIIETGETRSVMHFSLLIGYGANAIAPYLAFQTLTELKEKKAIGDEVELESAIEAFIALHRESSPLKEKFWETRGMTNFFREMTYRFFLQDWVELVFLWHEDEMMAALLNFVYSNQIYFYNSAYSRDFARYIPGIFLFNHSIGKAISEGREKADFLRGREEYKYYFGAEDSKIFCLKLIPQESKR